MIGELRSGSLIEAGLGLRPTGKRHLFSTERRRREGGKR